MLLYAGRKTPDHSQVELSDPLHADYPQWRDGDEAVVADRGCIAVATVPEQDGDVDIEVWLGVPEAASSWAEQLVFDGALHLCEDRLEVGSTIGGDLASVEIERGDYRARVFSFPSGYASRVVFVLDPSSDSSEPDAS